jgi:hypothetical protein
MPLYPRYANLGKCDYTACSSQRGSDILSAVTTHGALSLGCEAVQSGRTFLTIRKCLLVDFVEYGEVASPRNVGELPDYTASHIRR